VSLAYDMCRCAGERGEPFLAMEYVCPERNSCQRYLSTLTRAKVGVRVPYSQLLREPESKSCDYKIEKDI